VSPSNPLVNNPLIPTNIGSSVTGLNKQ